MHYVYNVLMLYVSCIVHTLEHVVSFLSCYVHTSSHVYMPICPVMLACHQFTITSYDRLQIAKLLKLGYKSRVPICCLDNVRNNHNCKTTVSDGFYEVNWFYLKLELPILCEHQCSSPDIFVESVLLTFLVFVSFVVFVHILCNLSNVVLVLSLLHLRFFPWKLAGILMQNYSWSKKTAKNPQKAYICRYNCWYFSASLVYYDILYFCVLHLLVQRVKLMCQIKQTILLLPVDYNISLFSIARALSTFKWKSIVILQRKLITLHPFHVVNIGLL